MAALATKGADEHVLGKEKVEEYMNRKFTSEEKKHLHSPNFSSMSPLQKDVLAVMKIALQEEFSKIENKDSDLLQDNRIYRFLQGQLFNLKDGVAFMKKAIAWRSESSVENIASNIRSKKEEGDSFMRIEKAPFWKEVSPVYPSISFFEGFASDVHFQHDKEGHPLIINQLGMSDISTISDGSLKEEEMVLFMTHLAEMRALHLSKLSQERQEIVRCFCLQDLNGLGLKHLASKPRYFIKLFISIMSDCYPEIMAKIRIINAPWAFSMAWTMVKPWLPERTIKKIKVLGSNYQDELLEEFDPVQLPKAYGGTLDVRLPALVPADSDVDAVTVSRSSQETISFPVKRDASFSFKFQCDAGDINVKVEFSRSGDVTKPTLLNSMERKSMSSTEIKVPSDADGNLSVTFDNNSSGIS